MRAEFWLCSILVLAGSRLARPASAGDEVVVVYNTRVAESRGVADYYAQRRGVPTNQVFGFDLPATEDISRVEFREGLQRPLAAALEKRKLWHIASRIIPATTNQPSRIEWRVMESKIRYAVLCYGVPLRIRPDENLKEEGAEKLRPELRRNEAAVDNELAVLPLIEERLLLAGPMRNLAYTATNAAPLNPTNGVLMVARLDGPSAAIARGLVDKALQAEATGLWGRAYFDLRNTSEPALKQGDEWIHNSAEIARRLGFETVVDDKGGVFPAGFPMSQIAFYAGWYTENVAGPFAQPTVEFVPGAFAYHLHSFSAASLRSTNHNWVGPFLAKGVTITMGCVHEPYLSGTPDIAVFTARLLYYAMTFGEAAYAGQSVLSWQTTVVGDPLYRPFGRKPEELDKELDRQQSPLLAWSFLRLVNLNRANGKPVAELVDFLEQLGLTKQSAILQEKLADLYAAQGKPASAAHAYEQALKLDPSPQQRLRLLLTLGDALPPLHRESDAYDSYQRLLKEFPDYPDKLALWQKMLPLAQKLGKTPDAEKFEAEINRLSSHPKS